LQINSDNTIAQKVVTVDPTDGGRAAYTFSVPASGKYTISALVNCPSDESNSYFVNIDAEPTTSMVWAIPIGSGLQSQQVTWNSGATAQVFTLSAGNHQLIVRGREKYTKLGDITIHLAGPAAPTNLHVAGN
jgi:hypothetical protein